MTTIVEIFCAVDDFCIKTENDSDLICLPTLNQTVKRQRASNLCDSEIMTILIHYQFSRYCDFKSYYLHMVLANMKKYFPGLVSYSRFVRLIPKVINKLSLLLRCSFSSATGISYIDSTEIPVCHKKRISRNKVFKGFAEVGKSSKGWFLGFKLHLLINHKGGLLGAKFTTANVDDRSPVLDMMNNNFGKLFADKGYISKKLTDKLHDIGVTLFTTIKSNMKPKIMTDFDRVLLKKRSLIESVNNQIKNFFEVAHTRHRSCVNAFCHMTSALIAYCFHPGKPKASIDETRITIEKIA